MLVLLGLALRFRLGCGARGFFGLPVSVGFSDEACALVFGLTLRLGLGCGARDFFGLPSRFSLCREAHALVLLCPALLRGLVGCACGFGCLPALTRFGGRSVFRGNPSFLRLAECRRFVQTP
jgi:hypothetical protein